MADNKQAPTAAAPTSVRYKATTLAKEFSGKTCGVKFEYGVAVFDDYTLAMSKNPTNRTAAEIAKIMQDDFHYTVEVVK